MTDAAIAYGSCDWRMWPQETTGITIYYTNGEQQANGAGGVAGGVHGSEQSRPIVCDAKSAKMIVGKLNEIARGESNLDEKDRRAILCAANEIEGLRKIMDIENGR